MMLINSLSTSLAVLFLFPLTVLANSYTTTETIKSTSTTCSYNPVSPVPSSLNCAVKGGVRNPKVLTTIPASTLAICTSACETSLKCASFSYDGTTCVMFTEVLLDMGLYYKASSTTSLWNRKCFTKSCVTDVITTTKTLVLSTSVSSSKVSTTSTSTSTSASSSTSSTSNSIMTSSSLSISSSSTTTTSSSTNPSATSCANGGLSWAYYYQKSPYISPHLVDPGTYHNATSAYNATTQGVGGFDYPGYEYDVAIYGSPALVDEYFLLNHWGYIYANFTGDYQFTTGYTDDDLWMWIGPYAFSGWNASNADWVVTQGNSVTYSVGFRAGNWYPFRLFYINGCCEGTFDLTITDPNGNIVLDGYCNDCVYPSVVRYSCDGTTAPEMSEGY